MTEAPNPTPNSTVSGISEENEWTFWWGEGTQPERLRPANSREDAIEQALEEYAGARTTTFTFCEGRRLPLGDACFDADHVLERWHDHNEDVQGEDGELGMEPTPEQEAELELALAETLKAWRKKHNLGRAWALETRNEETIVLPETESEDAAP